MSRVTDITKSIKESLQIVDDEVIMIRANMHRVSQLDEELQELHEELQKARLELIELRDKLKV